MFTERSEAPPRIAIEIPNAKISEIALKFANRYQLPDSIVTRAINTRGYIADTNIIRNSALWSLIEKYKRIKQVIHVTVSEFQKMEAYIAAINPDGSFGISPNGVREIMVTHIEHLPHEINHALSGTSFRQQGAWDIESRSGPDLSLLLEVCNDVLCLGVDYGKIRLADLLTKLDTNPSVIVIKEL